MHDLFLQWITDHVQDFAAKGILLEIRDHTKEAADFRTLRAIDWPIFCGSAIAKTIAICYYEYNI
jgi:hypothetical protein